MEKLRKFERLLLLYDVFLHTKEPDYETIRGLIPYPNRRMFQRDLRELETAGLVQKRLNRHGAVFFYEDVVNAGHDMKPENAQINYHVSKLRRLGLLMRELNTEEEEARMEAYLESCEYGEAESDMEGMSDVMFAKAQYYALVPHATERLRQRDFALLNRIGYKIFYRLEYREYVTCFPEGLAESYGLKYENGAIMRDTYTV